ncbi:MAG: hypothetical protein P4L84_13260 [Isosphaeraceae bacterium]|nr:hypothetical protein [Isosphaeraceae bacterium]
MSDDLDGIHQRFPQLGDIVLYGRSSDGKGTVSEVPAMVLGIQSPGSAGSLVDLKTFEIGHEMEPRREVKHTTEPRQGYWRWRPGR